jgi:NADH-quinone oxidoreductase subunit M
MSGIPWITLLTALPLVGGLVVLSAGGIRRARWMAATFGSAGLLLTLYLWHTFDAASGAMQFQERHAWLPALGVDYHVGADGLGLLMLLLSAIVVLMAMAAS